MTFSTSAALRRGVLLALATVWAGGGYALASAPGAGVAPARTVARVAVTRAHLAVRPAARTRPARPTLPAPAPLTFAPVPQVPTASATATDVAGLADLPPAPGSALSAGIATAPAGSWDPCATGGVAGATLADRLYAAGLKSLPLVQPPLAVGPVSRTIEFEGGGNPAATELACAVSLADENADGVP